MFFKVACHTNNIKKGSIFVCISGKKDFGTKYIKKAIMQGAKKIVLEAGCVLEEEILNLIKQNNIEIEFTDNPRQRLAYLSAEAYGWPAKKIKIIAVTGTKGKTTTAYLIEHCLKNAGYKTALITTVKNKILDKEYEPSLTTPQPDYLNYFLDQCVQNEVEYLVLETSAQAISCHRVDFLELDIAVFTNFSLEHLEFYGSLEQYFQAKSKIFDYLKYSGIGIINIDDENVLKCESKIKNCLTYSLKNEYREYSDFFNLSDKLFGEFNKYNILALIKTFKALKINLEKIKSGLKTFQGVPGRLEEYKMPNGSSIYIDYAHNPSSFEAVLKSLKEKADNLIVLFGAGGDRDSLKRPIMGKIAENYADKIILTSDNPRSENPENIISDILKGIQNKQNLVIEPDRQKAIEVAYSLSQKNSLIALLGKGPEEFQEINGIKYKFSEKEIIGNLCNK